MHMHTHTNTHTETYAHRLLLQASGAQGSQIHLCLLQHQCSPKAVTSDYLSTSRAITVKENREQTKKKKKCTPE